MLTTNFCRCPFLHLSRYCWNVRYPHFQGYLSGLLNYDNDEKSRHMEMYTTVLHRNRHEQVWTQYWDISFQDYYYSLSADSKFATLFLRLAKLIEQVLEIFESIFFSFIHMKLIILSFVVFDDEDNGFPFSAIVFLSIVKHFFWYWRNSEDRL